MSNIDLHMLGHAFVPLEAPCVTHLPFYTSVMNNMSTGKKNKIYKCNNHAVGMTPCQNLLIQEGRAR